MYSRLEHGTGFSSVATTMLVENQISKFDIFFMFLFLDFCIPETLAIRACLEI
jgi:hypothetical protein